MSLRSSEHEKIFEAIEAEQPPEGASTACWPDPAELHNDLLPVQVFEIELLPSSFRPLVRDVSERMQTPLDFAAVTAIVALAGCVNRRATIRPKAEDDSWSVVLNLWGMIIASPGSLKSPVQRTVTLPLTLIQDIWRAERAEALSNFQTEKELADLRWQTWREQSKCAMKKGAIIPTQPDNSLIPPSNEDWS